MTQQAPNDNRIASQTDAPFMKGLALSKSDIASLVFISLIINLFSLTVPLITLQVYDRILSFHSIGTLQVLTAGGITIVILDMVMKLARSRLIGWSSAKFEHTAYTHIIRHIMSMGLPDLKKFSTGELLQRIESIAKLRNFYSGQSLISLIDLPFVAIFIGFIAYLSGKLVLVPLTLLALFCVYALYLGYSMNKTLHVRDKNEDHRINFISETLGKIHNVKMLGLEAYFQRRYEDLQAQNIHDSHTLSGKNAQGYNAASLFTQIMMVAMISFGAFMVLDGQITMGVLIACVLLSGRIMQPLQRALSFWASFQEYKLAAKKMRGLLAQQTTPFLASDTLKKPKGKLEIKKLHFSHTDDRELFSGLTLSLAPGKVIALGGPPGDGKTSLLKLIAGLYTVDKGAIKIDGHDINLIPKTEIVKYVGYLPPDADIFEGSIMDNLTCFRSDMEDKAMEVCAYLGIDKVVSKLPHGYQTRLFDGPADPLTPGMKQRITIGRVLVNKPRLLLFDFADKSLDKDGYNHVFRLLGQLKGQASMILVSNDRNILHLAQEEYIIEDGVLVPLDDSQYSKQDNIVQPLKVLRS